MVATRSDRPGAEAWVPPSSDLDGLAAAARDCRGCELFAPAMGMPPVAVVYHS